MKRLTVSPRARRDLFAIWRFTARTWNAEQANRYIAAIDTAIERLTQAPERAVRCDAIRQGYARLKVGTHYIFTKQVGEELIVVRVLHERMNFPDHLND